MNIIKLGQNCFPFSLIVFYNYTFNRLYSKCTFRNVFLFPVSIATSQQEMFTTSYSHLPWFTWPCSFLNEQKFMCNCCSSSGRNIKRDLCEDVYTILNRIWLTIWTICAFQSYVQLLFTTTSIWFCILRRYVRRKCCSVEEIHVAGRARLRTAQGTYERYDRGREKTVPKGNRRPRLL